MQHIANLLAICAVCNHGVTLKSIFRGGGGWHPDLLKYGLDFPGAEFAILDVWPKIEWAIPGGVPENVASFYLQGVSNVKAQRWDAAGAMFRKTLDVATKIACPEGRSLNLFNRINKMVQDGAISAAMGDWSHEIRLDGNDAVHDDEPETEGDARTSYKFTEAFLTYAFSLPKLVSDNRAKRDAAKTVSK